MNASQLSAVASGYELHADAPGVAKHEHTVYKEHDDACVGTLIFPVGKGGGGGE